MTGFTHFLAVDWSGAKGVRQKGIAVAVALADGGPPVLVTPPDPKGWARSDVLARLRDLPGATLVGLDLGISLPHADAGAFFPGWDASPADARGLWALIDALCEGDPNLEAGGFVTHPQASRYFRHGAGLEGDRFLIPGAATREGRFRVAEAAQRQQGVRPVSNFNLVGAAQVGKSSLTGMRMLHRLGGKVPVWPVDPLPAEGSVITEIYTSVAARLGGVTGAATKLRSYGALNDALDVLGSPPVAGTGAIDDHSSDALLTAAWLRHVHAIGDLWHPSSLTAEIARTEGWTFGAV
ncbi:hypothetical protein C0V72_02175 [Porphyrobacter sp. TH134]|uniref:hypothetical protein n=1 Tax=Porphyrobacter sp. TH134 TaxID=2067450 RepID=UPI000C7C42FA|nr:hypothetical protein [Porphyrobacter sp. TH134]PLK25126.1 hypothetical protein C0V72_02175 [Porphyrobacter sp. TH134]